MTSPAPLRWERQSTGNAWYAYRGRHIVGMVVQVNGVSASHPRHGVFTYKVDAVHTKWIAKGNGHVKSLATAKKAVERAWDAWCDAFELNGR